MLALKVSPRLGPAAVTMALLVIGPAPALAQESSAFLSRISVEAPFYTRHLPDSGRFNDHNWGAIVGFDVARLDLWGSKPELAATVGYFRNSYYRNTAFAAAGLMWPLDLDLSHLKFDAGFMAGADLNHGYRGFNAVDPLLFALRFKVGGDGFDPQYGLLNRLGIAFTLIPGEICALNAALTVRL